MNAPQPPPHGQQPPGGPPQYPPPGYPANIPVPPQQQPGYHQQQPGYPQQQPGYPQQQPGYPPPGYAQQPGYPPPQPYPGQSANPQVSGGNRAASIVLGVAALATGLYVVIDALDNSSWLPAIPRLLGGVLMLVTGVLLFLRLRLALFVSIAGTAALVVQVIVTIITNIQEVDESRGESIADAFYTWSGFATLAPALIITVVTLLPPVFKNLKPVTSATRQNVPGTYQQYR